MSLQSRLSEDQIGDLIGPICTLAELPMWGEKKGVPIDRKFDELIAAARAIKEREGFAVHAFSTGD